MEDFYFSNKECYESKHKESEKVIYAIRNLNNNKVYIGQTSNCNGRRKQHISALRAGTHPVKEMQNDFDKGDLFKFYVFIYFPDSTEKEMLDVAEGALIRIHQKRGQSYNKNGKWFDEKSEQEYISLFPEHSEICEHLISERKFLEKLRRI